MEDMLFWGLLLFVAWIFESIASARRKKRQPPQTQRRPGRPPRPGPRPPPTADARPERQPRVPTPRRPEPPHPRPEREPVVMVPPDLIILREPSPEPAPSPTDSWTEGRTRRAIVRKPETLEEEAQVVSLETLEPAGGTSHVAFHEKYIDQPLPRRTVRRRLQLSRGDARRGIVLAEILGPPKSER